MPLAESSIQDISLKKKTLRCMKKEDAYIFGNYNSNSGRMLRVKLMKCSNESYCKSEKEILDFIIGKYFLFLNN